MKKLMWLITAALFLNGVVIAQPASSDENAAITKTALDYIEGWYAGDAARMERALHPELAKRMISNWRTSGWCPIGIALHRIGPTTTLPFPTWSIALAWMPAGTAIEILTARDDTKSPSFFIEPPALAVKEEANRKIPDNDPKRALFQHPIGVERVTAIQIIRPKEYQPVAAFLP